VFEEYLNVKDKKLKFTGIMVVWGCVCGIIGLITTFLYASSSFFLAEVAAEISIIGATIAEIGSLIFRYYRLRKTKFLYIIVLNFLLLLLVGIVIWPLSPSKILIGVGILAFSFPITGLIIVVAEKKWGAEKPHTHLIIVLLLTLILMIIMIWILMNMGIKPPHIPTESEVIGG